MSLIVSDKRRVILGLGKTGYSCVKFLSEQNIPVTVCDTRDAPPFLNQCKKEYPNVTIHLGELDSEYLAGFSQIIISPGLALNNPAIEYAKNKGVEIIGDVDLFVQNSKAQLIAITGSNAKSTVTSLVGHLLESINVKVKIGGNLGEPMLELLDDDTQVYVLELSSFQLETTHQLNADVATVLNASEDHMDRYASFAHYHLAKHRIFNGCKKIVINKDDALSQPLVSDNYPAKLFTKNKPDINQFGLVTDSDGTFLAKGFIQLVNVNELNLMGTHNYCNYLASLALCESLGYSADQFIEALKSFKGLAHRCEKIATIKGVIFVNDSKATNVGATLAAIDGLNDKAIHLVLGGVGKGADFSKLKPAIKNNVNSVSLIGECADELFELLNGECKIQKHKTLNDSVKWLFENANEGEVVMLSPACASFDMFENFEKRGEEFLKIVEALK